MTKTEKQKEMNSGSGKIHEVLEAYVPEIPRKGTAILSRLLLKLSILRRPAVFHYDFDGAR